MAGKKTPPDQSVQVVVLREAGYTLSAIADRLGMSVSTTQRIIRRNNAVAGATSEALVSKAREQMLNSSFALEEIQMSAAAMVLDDLSITRQIRAKLALSVDQLDVTAPTAFRSLAAASTSLKLTQDVYRRSLPMDKLEEALEVEQLPELHIRIMSENDVAVMRAQQRREDAELNGDLAGMSDEDENLKWLADRRAAQTEQTDEDDDLVIEG
ncbi:helix-turn-helix domain-containing protein [Pseudomonas sp. UBA4194]|uniref:helix-turn-helix domain-containing protein n=1 Tax=Pseudomonas sp. UBA4194 TaxID=1947317 RepID=UPI0025E3CB68|nr:helix-turn-helix domain-containing protein [Pseudomonas sp. UBA4194]